jgi:NAD-dependent deacetylase
MDESIKTAAKIIRNSKNLIALTGAGISVPSGIPDFRSRGGLWDKYDPAIYANIASFQKHPEKVWDMIFDMMSLIIDAEPNEAHNTLAKLENLGILKALVTQNIDGLHGKAGSRKVIEFHGNTEFLECLKCGKSFKAESYEIIDKKIPLCTCGFVLKPSVIFFGEAIPENALLESADLAASADAVIVIGTSAAVYPAAAIPAIAKENGATVIEFNIEESEITSALTNILIIGQVDETLPAVLNLIID